jgi:hypothetical protein
LPIETSLLGIHHLCLLICSIVLSRGFGFQKLMEFSQVKIWVSKLANELKQRDLKTRDSSKSVYH